ncbi:MAG: rod shape-determining protein MreC [Gammaproteobacteria bacterium]|nr:rod shape-determining protein MreC [Gammaproteobacteria bacterium]
MQQIINFIIRNKNFLLFLLLFSISLVFTIQSHEFHKSKFINSANFLSGGLLNTTNNISEYFHLKSQNKLLVEENKTLKSLLFNSQKETDSVFTDTTSFENTYKITAANIIRNNYAATDNFLLINKGRKDSIKEDLGVISSKGIVGIVDNTSAHYATVISILNTSSRISAQLKKTNHFGTLRWNAKDPNIVQLYDVEKIAPVKVGDTIVTSGRSIIFPKGVNIGYISDFKMDAAENFYEIQVTLFNDMTNLEHVYVIENKDAPEIEALLNKDTN